MLEIVESKYGYIVLVTCPHCGKYSEEDWQTLFAAYVDNAPLRHLDCGKDFFVELSCLTRVVEQRDEAAKQDGAGESPKSLRTEDHVEPVGQTCPNCDGEGTGFEDGESWTCSLCNGSGQV